MKVVDDINDVNFKKRLAKLLRKVTDYKSPLLITHRNLASITLISLKNSNSYDETLYLLSSSTKAQRLR